MKNNIYISVNKMEEDIGTPVTKGVTLRSGTILRPTAELVTPAFKDASYQEQTQEGDRITDPHPIIQLRLNTK